MHGLPSQYNPTQPWDFVFREAARDEAFWTKHMDKEALMYATRLQSAEESPTKAMDAYAKACRFRSHTSSTPRQPALRPQAKSRAQRKDGVSKAQVQAEDSRWPKVQARARDKAWAARLRQAATAGAAAAAVGVAADGSHAWWMGDISGTRMVSSCAGSGIGTLPGAPIHARSGSPIIASGAGMGTAQSIVARCD